MHHPLAKYFCMRNYFFQINYQEYVQLLQALLTKYLQVLQNRGWSIKMRLGYLFSFWFQFWLQLSYLGYYNLKWHSKPFWFANLIHYFSFQTFKRNTCFTNCTKLKGLSFFTFWDVIFEPDLRQKHLVPHNQGKQIRTLHIK